MSSVMTLKSYGTNRFGKIGARRMVSTLPYDAEVEWLESTGTQWIDTGVFSRQGICMELKAKVTTFLSSNVFAGCVNEAREGIANRFWVGAQYSSQKFYYAINTYSAVDYPVDFDSHKFILDTTIGQFKIDDVVYATFGDLNQSPLMIWAFAANYNYVPNNPSNCRIEYLKLKRDDTIVRDFVPVRIGSVGALYDRRGVGGMNGDGSARTDGLYFNRGTGAFIVGPDKIA